MKWRRRNNIALTDVLHWGWGSSDTAKRKPTKKKQKLPEALPWQISSTGGGDPALLLGSKRHCQDKASCETQKDGPSHMSRTSARVPFKSRSLRSCQQEVLQWCWRPNEIPKGNKKKRK